MKAWFFSLLSTMLFLASVSLAAPLTVHPTNPRYFSDGSGKAVYLTGSHTWGNLVDYPTLEWPAFDERADANKDGKVDLVIIAQHFGGN